MTLEAVRRHADAVTALQAVGVRAGRRAWAKVSTDAISESWSESLRTFAPVQQAAQVKAAVLSSEYGADALAEQGVYRPVSAFVDADTFGDYWPSTGATLDDALQAPAIAAKQAIASGADPAKALDLAGSRLDLMIRSALADAARQAASVDIAARPGVGYVRQLVGTSCPDCVILAGRFYRWNSGFKRHPGDDCIHVPSTQAISDTVLTDPYRHFEAMTEDQQDQFWGRGDAQAIRDGADIYQVANARRSRKGAFTTAGTTRRGTAGRQLKRGQRRMTPDAIYAQATSRDQALELLREHAYILPGGQTPGGSLRGRREGFGQMGRGGRAAAAKALILAARETGERDPRNRYTMTAAERRLYDAERNWEMVRQGTNPYASGGPLTPEIAAKVEKTYRRWLRTGGHYF